MRYLLVAFVFVSNFCWAQNQSSFPYLSSKEEGFLIEFDGDTLYGQLIFKKLPSYIELKQGKDRTKYYSGQIKKAEIEEHTFIPVAYKKKITVGGSKKNILEIVDTGYVKLYRFFGFGDGRNTSGVSKKNSFETYIVMHKPGKEAVGLNNNEFQRFATGIEKYVGDYSDLMEKIKNKEKGYAKRKDIENIIAEYNINKENEIRIEGQKRQQEELKKKDQEKESLKKELELELREELEKEIREEYERKLKESDTD